jgi:hypothetical protein
MSLVISSTSAHSVTTAPAIPAPLASAASHSLGTGSFQQPPGPGPLPSSPTDSASLISMTPASAPSTPAVSQVALRSLDRGSSQSSTGPVTTPAQELVVPSSTCSVSASVASVTPFPIVPAAQALLTNGDPQVHHPETVRCSGKEFNEIVCSQIDCIPSIDNESLRRVLQCVDSVFEDMADLLLTTDSFELIKWRAIQNINKNLQGCPQLSRIIQIVSENYDWVFQYVQRNALTPERVRDMWPLYSNFLEKYALKYSPMLICFEMFRDRLSYIHDASSLNYRNIHVECSIEEMQRVYAEHGVLQLRPIDKNAKILIIGCGNGRNTGGAGEAFDWNNPSDGDCYRKYSLEHNHPRNVVTIDPDLAANPTIVAFFGDQSVAQLFAGQQFDQIIFEGFYSFTSQAYRRSDIEALLSPTGKVYLDEGPGPQELREAL